MVRFWVGVASKDHVHYALEYHICQVCHGKKTPLNRMKKGDYFLYYSPKETFKGTKPLQATTAIGKVMDDSAYQVEHLQHFFPFRRAIYYYQPAKDCPIQVLRQHPEWVHYSSQVRYGHFEVSKDFFLYVFDHMKLD